LGISGATIRSSSKAGTSASVAGAVGIPVSREAWIGLAVAAALGSDDVGAVALGIVLGVATGMGDGVGVAVSREVEADTGAGISLATGAVTLWPSQLSPPAVRALESDATSWGRTDVIMGVATGVVVGVPPAHEGRGQRLPGRPVQRHKQG